MVETILLFMLSKVFKSSFRCAMEPSMQQRTIPSLLDQDYISTHAKLASSMPRLPSHKFLLCHDDAELRSEVCYRIEKDEFH